MVLQAETYIKICTHKYSEIKRTYVPQRLPLWPGMTFARGRKQISLLSIERAVKSLQKGGVLSFLFLGFVCICLNGHCKHVLGLLL